MIQTTSKETIEKTGKYPYIGKCTEKKCKTFVLFTSEGTGTVIHAEGVKPKKVGTHSTVWNEVLFKPYNGTINIHS